MTNHLSLIHISVSPGKNSGCHSTCSVARSSPAIKRRTISAICLPTPWRVDWITAATSVSMMLSLSLIHIFKLVAGKQWGKALIVTDGQLVKLGLLIRIQN